VPFDRQDQHALSTGRAKVVVYTLSSIPVWLAQPRLHGLFVGEVLVFLLFKES